MPVSAPSRAACPDEDDLVLYLEAQLGPEETARIEEHLDVCAACHRVAAAVAQADSRVLANDSSEPTTDRPRPGTRTGRPARRLPPGSAVGRYVVGELLGEGGMGIVYAAHDTELDRHVALKVVAGTGHDADGLRKRLLREARLAAQLRHANVVVVHDVGEANGYAYLAMELVRGRSLRACVSDASISIRTRLGWLVDVASALAAAHARGLVHRDVKPENVMVDEASTVKVVDFGIARNFVQHVDMMTAERPALASAITRKGALIGTPAYMAPEQLRDEPVDARIDQFAWGVLAHELLSGTRPWKERSLAMVGEILTADPPPLPDEVPRQVRAIVRKAMAKAPDQRFASMDLLVSALLPYAVAEGARRWPQGMRQAWTLAAAIAVVGGVVFLATRGSSAVSSPSIPVAETVPVASVPPPLPALPERGPPAPLDVPGALPPSPRSPTAAAVPRSPRVFSLPASAVPPASSVDPLDFRK
jgi:hypothetical protein